MAESLTLSSSIREVQGIGTVAEQSLAKAGIRTVEDLLRLFPKNYRDYSDPKPLSAFVPAQEDFFEAQITAQPALRRGKSGVQVITFSAASGGQTARITIFNQPYLLRRLRAGATIYMFGQGIQDGTFVRFTAPQVLLRRPEEPIAATYQTISGITNAKLRSAIRFALRAVVIDEPYSDAFLERYDIPTLRDAFSYVHNPRTVGEEENGMRRFYLEDCLSMARALDILAAERTVPNQIPVDAAKHLPDFLALLPFTPTGAQMRAMEDIAADLEGPVAMNRLLQGDVGSGKTVVAFFAAYCFLREGYEVPFLVPTEVLARQHYGAAQDILGDENVFLLTGQMKASERTQMRARLEQAHGALLIGTHALLYGELGLRHPALLITDEQHRFGVRQRGQLLGPEEAIHSLTMSATPIPRSLALAMHGQTNISVLDELPPGRQPIQTSYVPARKLKDMFSFIAKRAKDGAQAYIVCPAIEENPDFPMQAAVATHEKLVRDFPDVRFGLLHGKCTAEEKENVMRSFAAGETQVLVTTTVIEVGVDVPNATVMAILDAERFGLAQLHQLRGRVGRGDQASYCFLTTSEPKASQRLQVLCKTGSGFEIAEADLKERGAGDFLGQRQHGAQGALTILCQENGGLLERLRADLDSMSRDPSLVSDFRCLSERARDLLENKLGEIVFN